MTTQITVYEMFAIMLSVISLILWFLQWRDNKEDRREKFFQSLISGFYTHNWKFIEHWSNPGVRPQMDETQSVEKNEEEIGRRIVVLDHVNILMQVFLHRKVLTINDIDSFGNWARSWFEGSKAQLKVIFTQGDLYPLDYIVWLRDEIFEKEKFQEVIGRPLEARLRQFEARRRR